MSLALIERPRRNRKSAAIRAWHRETFLTADHLVWPVFIHAKNDDEAIGSMPGCSRLSPDGLDREVGQEAFARETLKLVEWLAQLMSVAVTRRLEGTWRWRCLDATRRYCS